MKVALIRFFLMITCLGLVSCDSGVTPAMPVPAAPTGLAIASFAAENDISWAATTYATSYNIYWSKVSGVTPSIGTKIKDASNPYSHTGLTNNASYYYIVTAANATGESDPSAEISSTPNLKGVLDTSYAGGAGYVLSHLDYQPLPNDGEGSIAVGADNVAFFTDPLFFQDSAVDAKVWMVNDSGVPILSPFSPGTNCATKAAVSDQNGNFIATGFCSYNPGYMFVIKLDELGNRDSSFNNGTGYYLSVIKSIGEGIVRDGSGNLYIGGNGGDGASACVFVWKLSAEGVLDATFGTAGVASECGGAGYDFVGGAVGLDSNGNIIVVGANEDKASLADFRALWKFSPAGNLLASNVSNEGGKLFNVALDSNDNIYSSGNDLQSGDGYGDLIVGKFDNGLNVATSFGTNGYYIGTDPTCEAARRGIAFDKAGRLIVTTSCGNGIETFMMVIMFDKDTAAKVESFATSGVYEFPLTGANGIAIDAGGRALLGGIKYTSQMDASIMVMRLK